MFVAALLLCVESLELRYKACSPKEGKSILQAFCRDWSKNGREEGVYLSLSPYGTVEDGTDLDDELVLEFYRASRIVRNSRFRPRRLRQRDEIPAGEEDPCCQESCIINSADLHELCKSQ